MVVWDSKSERWRPELLTTDHTDNTDRANPSQSVASV